MTDRKTARQKAEARFAGSMSSAKLSQIKRIKAMRARHIKSNRDGKMRALYEQLFVNTQLADTKLAGIVVMGRPGSGKTHAVRQMESLPEFQPYWDEDEPDFQMLPYISIDCPPRATPPQLLAEIVKACGFPVTKPGSVAEMIDLAMKWFERRSVMFVHIDEFQHALRNLTEIQVKDIQEAIKLLIQVSARWPVKLILSGTNEIEEFRRGDGQLKVRTFPLDLDSLSPEKDVLRVSKVARGIISEHANLTPVDLDHTDFSMRLMKSANHQFGNVIEISRLACERAIFEDRTTVDINDFGEVYSVLSGSNSNESNMFWSPEWEKIAIPTSIVDGTAFEDRAVRKRKTYKVRT